MLFLTVRPLDVHERDVLVAVSRLRVHLAVSQQGIAFHLIKYDCLLRTVLYASEAELTIALRFHSTRLQR